MSDVTELLKTAFEHEEAARELRRQAGQRLTLIAESEKADAMFYEMGLDRPSAFRLIRLAAGFEGN